MRRIANLFVPMFALLVLCASVGCGSSKQAKVKESVAPMARVDYNDPIVTDPDELPQYSGGEDGLRKAIKRKLKYPDEAYKQSVQGRIFCTAVVRRDGTIHDVKLARRGNFLLEQEAIRVLSVIPAYNKPAMKDGQPVSVTISIPVDFSISNVW